MVWEVKPYKETKEPRVSRKITKKYIREVTTYGTNRAKWVAATKFCEDKGWEFKIITENLIYGDKSSNK